VRRYVFFDRNGTDLIMRTVVVAAHEVGNLNACRTPRQERIFLNTTLANSLERLSYECNTLTLYECSLFHARE
jgi:hypothetical protein